MGTGAYDAAIWAKKNTPSRDASSAEWEEFARKAIDFAEKYRGEPEYKAVCTIIKNQCDAVFEGVPIIQKEPIRLKRGKNE